MPVHGQLWWSGEGDPADARIVYVNDDGSNQTVEADNDPATELVTDHVQDIGLDTAAGFYFALVNFGAFGDGARLVRGAIGGSGPATVVADFQVGSDPGDSNGDDLIVNAMQVDDINHKIYVGVQDPFGDASNTGIRQYSYDPLTGAVTDEGFLVRADIDNTKPIDPDNFGLDLLNARDFDLDLSSNTLYFTELFTGGLQEQGLYRMDLTTHDITQMVSSLQFPDEGTSGFIIDVEVDPTTDLVYFSTESQQPFGDPGYDPAQNAIWYVNQGATDAVATQLVLLGLPLGSHIYPGDMTFDQDQRRLYVESEESDGTSSDDVIYVFQLDATGATATLVETIAPSPGFSSSDANIQGMAYNALPHLTGVNGTATPAAEQGAAVTLLTGAPTITDVDGDHLASATVKITGGTFVSNETSANDDNLGIGAGLQQSGLVAGTNITLSWNQATSTLTLTGYDTLANYEAVLGQVAYRSTGDNPTNYGANSSRTLTWTVSDGALGVPDGQQNSQTSTVTIAASDDAPVNTVPGPVSTSEDVASVAITGLSVSDVDSTSLTVNLSVGRGTLNVDTGVSGGVGAGQVSGNGTGSVTITGTQAQIDATFAAATGVAYTPTPNVNGPDTLTMTTNGGSASDVDTVTINVAAVNDAPTVAGDGTESAAPIVEDMPSATGQSVSSLFGGQYSDATDQVPGGSSADAFAGVAVTANGSGAAGQWQYFNGSSWVNIGAASTASAVLLAAGTSIRFNPAPNFNGAAPTLTVHLVDASGGALTDGAHADLSVTGGTTPYSNGTVVLDESVTADNDAPVNNVPGPVATSEDAASVAITGLSVSDVDSSSLTVTLSVGRGTLAIDTAVSGGVGAGQVSGNGTGSVTITGSQAQIDATFAAATGVAYTPTHNVNGPDTLTMTTSDGSASDSDNVTINVAAVNDAPTVAGDGTESAAPILQDTPSPTGQSVASLFAGQYSDAADQVPGGSSADAFAGVAVTANGSGASGQWQYFNGVSWVNVGAASDSAAVLLAAGTSIRFNPAPGFNGAAPTLTTHLVDGSAGALTNGTIVDASATGGTTRYSNGNVVLSETVIATNTAPTGVTGTLAVAEDSHNGTIVGTLTATDPDSSTFTYTLVNDAGGRFDINATTGVVTVENGLLLDYEQAHSHTIRVQVDDHEGGVSQFDVAVTVNDVHGEFVVGDNAGNTIYGGAETDILLGSHGSDVIHGGGGTDIIAGGNGLFDSTDGGDFLFGDGGDDIIDGNGGDDVIAGGAGSDVITGAEGNDTIYGGDSATDTTDTGNDILSGDAGNDIIYGNGGNDFLYGGDDNDQLFGGAGTDTLDGGNGNDVLNGGAGADTLTGGAGNDVFVFHKGEANGDVVTDFNGNGAGLGDSIRLEGYAAGTTFTRVGHTDQWRINDHGFIETVTLTGHPAVHPTDVSVVP